MKEWEKQYQPPVIHLGRVLSVGDGIARVYGLKSVQVGAIMLHIFIPSMHGHGPPCPMVF